MAYVTATSLASACRGMGRSHWTCCMASLAQRPIAGVSTMRYMIATPAREVGQVVVTWQTCSPTELH